MLSFLKRKKTANETSIEQSNSESPTNTSLFQRLKSGLSRTRANLGTGLANLFLGHKTIDPDLLAKIEMHLLSADVGLEVTETLIKAITAELNRQTLNDVTVLLTMLKQHLKDILLPCQIPLQIESNKKPYVILMIGINGSGKTTTIGKLAHILQTQGKSVMLAAGDTFRAAAIEQLQVWGERNGLPVITQQSGADSASVIYDALAAAKARGIDVLIADTAGRLHTQHNLLAELQKIKHVLTKLDTSAPHEVMLVLDAGIGQNALNQAKTFHQEIGVTGITLTKLDGTAKGGIIFAIAKQLGLPIRFIGVGESIEDLQSFDAEAFIDALFNDPLPSTE